MGPNLFTSLAAELLLEIFSKLDPATLLTMSQVCKALHKILTARSVWEEALRSICCKNRLFEPSYPVDAMTVEELQRAAFGPTLWHRKILHYSTLTGTGTGTFVPVAERSLRSDPEAEAVGGLFRQIVLVPGGRYLISLNVRSIQLWDLDGPGRLSTRPSELIETLTVDPENPVLFLSGPVEHDRCVRFTALACPSVDFGMCLVYEIGPLPGSTTIRKIAQIEYRGWRWPRCQPQMSRRYVVLTDRSDRMFIWDFQQGTSILWHSPFTFCQVVVLDDLFVGFTKFEIVGWTLPEQSPKEDGNPILQLEATDIIPCFRTTYGPPTQPPTVLRVLTPSQWYLTETSTTQSSLFFDLATEPDAGAGIDSHLQRFRLTIDKEDPSRSTLTFLCEKFIFSTFVDGRDLEETSPSISLGHFSMLIFSQGRRFMDLDKLVYSPAAVRENADWKVVSMRRTEHLLHDSSAVCPASGRFVYFCVARCAKGHGRGYLSDRIRVVDVTHL